MVAKLRTLPELRDVASDQQDQGLQAALAVDRDTASRLGITASAIDETLYDAFGQRQVSTMFTQLNQYRVVLEVLPEFRRSPAQLQDLYLTTSTGGQIPLAAFTHLEPRTTSLAVNHQGQFPVVTLSFNLAPDASLGAAVAAITRAEEEIGLPASIQGAFQGTAQAFQAALAHEPILILAALVTVYIVLGVLYESYVHPLTILSTLPSAGVGRSSPDVMPRRVRDRRADRDHPADRHRQEECDHDDRLRARRGAQRGPPPRDAIYQARSCASGRS